MNNVSGGSWFVKLALVMWLVSSVFVVFCLVRLENGGEAEFEVGFGEEEVVRDEG